MSQTISKDYVNQVVEEQNNKLSIIQNENERLNQSIQVKEASLENLFQDVKQLKTELQVLSESMSEQHQMELEILKNEIERLNQAFQYKTMELENQISLQNQYQNTANDSNKSKQSQNIDNSIKEEYEPKLELLQNEINRLNEIISFRTTENETQQQQLMQIQKQFPIELQQKLQQNFEKLNNLDIKKKVLIDQIKEIEQYKSDKQTSQNVQNSKSKATESNLKEKNIQLEEQLTQLNLENNKLNQKLKELQQNWQSQSPDEDLQNINKKILALKDDLKQTEETYVQLESSQKNGSQESKALVQVQNTKLQIQKKLNQIISESQQLKFQIMNQKSK